MIKLSKKHKADYRFVNCPMFNVETAECVFSKYSNKYGYKYCVIIDDGNIYLTQALYEPIKNIEHISVHPAHSINDAKSIIKVFEKVVKSNKIA